MVRERNVPTISALTVLKERRVFALTVKLLTAKEDAKDHVQPTRIARVRVYAKTVFAFLNLPR